MKPRTFAVLLPVLLCSLLTVTAPHASAQSFMPRLPADMAAVAQMGDLSRMVPTAPLGRAVRTVGIGGKYPPTFLGISSACAASVAGDVVMIQANTAVAASRSATINVPYGVSLVGMGAATSTIVMPAGDADYPTITFRGGNYIEGIGFYHQNSVTGNQAGGICLCGIGHTFVNCITDGNQDCFCAGESDGAAGAKFNTTAVTSLVISGTTLSKTAAFTNYTWQSGDSVVIYAGSGATVGIYSIASRTSADAVVLGSAPGDSAAASAYICSQYSQWYGGTRFINHRETNWNFDWWKNLAVAPVGQQDIVCRTCDFLGTPGAGGWMRDFVNLIDCSGCVWDTSRFTNDTFSMIGRSAGISYKSAQLDASTPSILTITGGDWDGSSTLTKTAAFATYTYRPGDTCVVSAGGTVGTYYVTGRLSANAIKLATSMGGSASGTVNAVINPQYRAQFKNCTIRSRTLTATNSLFKLSAVATAARSGITVVCDGVDFDVPAGTYLFKGSAHATVSPKSSIALTNCKFPPGWQPTTAASNAPMININLSNCPTLQIAGGTPLTYPVTDASSVVIQPNLAQTHSWTCTQATSLSVSANAGSYLTGQEFEIMVAHGASTHNITPDGSTVLGATLACVANKTITARYRYNGTAWIQTAAQTTGY